MAEEIIEGYMPLEIELPPIAQGMDWAFTIWLLDENENPINTTGYSVEMQMRDKHNQELIDTLSTSNGKVVNTPAEGMFVFSETAANTLSLFKIGQVMFDIKINDAGSGVTRPFKGTIPVVEAVTR